MDPAPSPPPPPGEKPERNFRTLLYYLLLFAAVLLVADLLTPGTPVDEIPFSEFEQRVAAGEVSSVVVDDRRIEGVLTDTAGVERAFVTRAVDPELAAMLREYGVEFTGGDGAGGFPLSLLFWLGLTVVLLGFWFWFFRRMGRAMAGGPLTFGKSKAKIHVQEHSGATFQDVAGVDEARGELEEVVGFLRNPDEFTRLGAHLPKGILLVGPPGTGKTLLARAVAGEAGVPFFSINGSEFVELFVGVGAARVRDLFDQARQRAPCIVFIDELDALGRARGLATPGGNDEKEQTLNQLLAEMDGFSPESRVILLAATNRPEILDPALLRAGRFDRQVLVDRPDRQGRVAILEVHVRRVSMDPEVKLEDVAALTPGFTGADIANLVNEATLVATRRGGDSVNHDDFVIALERVVAGLAKKSRLLGPRERSVVAYHEMGHALVGRALQGLVDPVEKVSIIPHGIAGLGYTLQRPTEDRYLITRSELEARLAVLLGGRAAEILVFQEFSSGAANDLEKATEIASEMVMRLGMDPAVGQVVYGGAQTQFLGGGVAGGDGPRSSERTARDIELAVRSLIQAAFERAHSILAENRMALDEGARLLLERESLTRDELPEVVRRVAAPLDAPTPAVAASADVAPGAAADRSAGDARSFDADASAGVARASEDAGSPPGGDSAPLSGSRKA
jgi:cell division protease FtsH